MKKKFVISSHHDIYVDDWNEGELDFVNGYSMSETIEAETWKEAVNTYFEKVLHYNLGIENCDIEDDYIVTSCLVDEDILQPTDKEVEDWKEGKRTLYSNVIMVYVDELIKVEFN